MTHSTNTDMRDEAELTIWRRVFEPHASPLPSAIADFLLELDFPEKDVSRMGELSMKANAGTLTAAESVELEAFSRVGTILSILQSKARQAKKKPGSKRAKV